MGASSRAITLSWLHYDGVTSDECDGEHTRAMTATDAELTVHHCFFDHVESHAPRVDGASAGVHLFDNLISDDRLRGPSQRAWRALGARGLQFQRRRRGSARGADGQEPHDAVFSPPYVYRVEPAQDEWLTVLSRAGAGGPWALPLSRNCGRSSLAAVSC